MPNLPRVSPWRLPYQGDSTQRDRSVKRVTIHFRTRGDVVVPPIPDPTIIIRYEQPYKDDILDNAFGIIGERSTMWTPRHAIKEGELGKDHPDFVRSGKTGTKVDPTTEELWNLWQ